MKIIIFGKMLYLLHFTGLAFSICRCLRLYFFFLQETHILTEVTIILDLTSLFFVYKERCFLSIVYL